MERYLFLSDAHVMDKYTTARIVYNAMRKLKIDGQSKEVNALIIGGDFSGNNYNSNAKKDYLEYVLTGALMTKKEIFFVPGNHESVFGSELFLMELAYKYRSQFMTALNAPACFKRSDHNLIVLPGGDLNSEDSFIIDPRNRSGYFNNGESFSKNCDLSSLMNVLKNPRIDILLSHNAPFLGDYKEGIDEAHLAKNTKTNESTIMNYLFEHMASKYGSKYAPSKMTEEGWVPFTKNVGNQFLGELVKQGKIRRSISGHVHESAGRASCASGLKAQEGIPMDELFINGSHMDRKIGTVLEVEGSKTRFFRINLTDYI